MKMKIGVNDEDWISTIYEILFLSLNIIWEYELWK